MGKYTQRRKAEFQARKAARNFPISSNRFMKALIRAFIMRLLFLCPIASYDDDQGEFRNVTLLTFVL